MEKFNISNHHLRDVPLKTLKEMVLKYKKLKSVSIRKGCVQMLPFTITSNYQMGTPTKIELLSKSKSSDVTKQ